MKGNKPEPSRSFIDTLPPHWVNLLGPWVFWTVIALILTAALSCGWWWFR